MTAATTGQAYAAALRSMYSKRSPPVDGSLAATPSDLVKPEVKEKVQSFYQKYVVKCVDNIVSIASRALSPTLTTEEAQGEVAGMMKATQKLAHAVIADHSHSGVEISILPRDLKPAFALAHDRIQLVLAEMHTDTEKFKHLRSQGILESKLANIGSWYKHTTELSGSISRIEKQIVQTAMALEKDGLSESKKKNLEKQLGYASRQLTVHEKMLESHLEREPTGSTMRHMRDELLQNIDSAFAAFPKAEKFKSFFVSSVTDLAKGLLKPSLAKS